MEYLCACVVFLSLYVHFFIHLFSSLIVSIVLYVEYNCFICDYKLERGFCKKKEPDWYIYQASLWEIHKLRNCNKLVGKESKMSRDRYVTYIVDSPWFGIIIFPTISTIKGGLIDKHSFNHKFILIK